MAVVNFYGFSVAVYCILVIYQKKYPCLVCHFDIHIKPGMPDFATAAMLRRIKGV